MRDQLPATSEAAAIPGPIPVLTDLVEPNNAPPPVPAQRASHVNAAKLQSETIVVSAPLSFAGSAARIWKLTGMSDNAYARVGLAGAALVLISFAWSFV